MSDRPYAFQLIARTVSSRNRGRQAGRSPLGSKRQQKLYNSNGGNMFDTCARCTSRRSRTGAPRIQQGRTFAAKVTAFIIHIRASVGVLLRDNRSRMAVRRVKGARFEKRQNTS